MTETDPSALLPCPFCGAKAFSRDDTRNMQSASVECLECDASTKLFSTVVQAIAAWNRRAPVAPISATLEGSAQHHDALTAHQVGRTPAVTEITDEMVEAACRRFYPSFCDWSGAPIVEATLSDMRAALTAVLSIAPQAQDTRKILESICQRANESGPGEMSAVNTIHAMHELARRALSELGLASARQEARDAVIEAARDAAVGHGKYDSKAKGCAVCALAYALDALAEIDREAGR